MKVVRLGLSVILAMLVTFSLFVLMYELIASNLQPIGDEKYEKIADIFQQDKEIEENIKQLRTKKVADPQPPPAQLPREKLAIKEVGESVQMSSPNLTATTDFGIGGLGGDGEYIPLVKIQPQYPRRALQRGMGGFVDLEFTITTSGSIKDPVVLHAEDDKGRATTIFNKSAIKAALKLKYKPRVVAGQAVEVVGVPHRFRFQIKK